MFLRYSYTRGTLILSENYQCSVAHQFTNVCACACPIDTLNMNKKVTRILYLINVVFTIMCVSHVSITLYNAVNPNRPEIKVYDKALKDVPFPILFKLCGKEIQNSSRRFKEYGYKNERDFYSGKSKFSKSLVGWNGHTENGSTLETVKGNANL